MDPEEVYRFAEEAVRAATERGLNNVQQIILKGSLRGETYEQIAETCHYSVGYLKRCAGPLLWETLTEALREEIGKTNCQAVLERRLRNVESVPENRHYSPARPDWFANEFRVPELGTFLGRTTELNRLEQWIVTDRCRLILLSGAGGIGKTSLVAKLADHVRNQVDDFNAVLWVSLITAPPIEHVFRTLLEGVSPEQAASPESPEQRMPQIMHLLRTYRLLLVFDHVETLFRAGDRAGYFDPSHRLYEEFIQQLSETTHRSCVVLISREEPVIQHRGEPYVQRLKLKGLQPEDAKQIIEFHGVSSAQRGVEELIQLYRGNPLALRMAISTIQEVFSGNIYQLLSQGTVLVDDPLLSLLREQFNRLSELERNVLYWLIIESNPLSFTELRVNVRHFITSGADLMVVLQSLKRRSMLEDFDVEVNGTSFSLPPMVRKYGISKLIEQSCQDISSVLANQSVQQFGLLKTHLLIKDQSPTSMSQSTQLDLLCKPILHRLYELFQDQNEIKTRLKRLLERLQGKATQFIGYADVNIQNLLELIDGEAS